MLSFLNILIFAPFTLYIGIQTLWEKGIYSVIVQRKIVFRFLRKMAKIIPIFLIFNLCTPYLQHRLLECSQIIIEIMHIGKVVQRQLIFRFVKNCQNFINFSKF